MWLSSGCFKEEAPIKPFPRGEVEMNVIEMTKSYGDFHYFDFEKKEVIKVVKKTAWDLGYSCNPDNKTVVLNTGKNMRAGLTQSSKLEEVTDTFGVDFRWDWSSGREDSTALHNWWEGEKVYILNLGTDEDNNELGLIKIKLIEDGEDIKIQYANLTDNNIKEVTLSKDLDYNYVYISFDRDGQVWPEPKKTEYDIVFRQYVYYFAPEDLDYLVVGAVINPYKVSVAKINDKDFTDIELADTNNYELTNDFDGIGFDWKEFILSDGIYKVYADKNFLIKTTEGFFYKMHFTNYYSNSGETGFPTMEFKLL
jgi:hypothetical protein